MKAILTALLGLSAAALVLCSTSCGTFTGDGFILGDFNLPIEMGIEYELEDGLSVQVFTADKGGIEVNFVGVGELSEHIKKIEGGFEITSPNTGFIYRITESSLGNPRVTIVGGVGKLKPITPRAKIIPEK